MRRLSIVVLAIIVASLDLQAQDLPPAALPESRDGGADDAGLVRKLFTTIVRDIARLPSKENRTILITGGLIAAAAHPRDDEATYSASSSEFLKASFGGYGKAIGREWVQGGAALAGYIAGRLWAKPKLTAVSGDLIEAQLVAVTLTQGLKFVVSRTRPDGEARSFPSGHASAAFATASTLQRHFGRKAAIPAYAVAAYTSASRLQANSHYASDVIVGATLGIAIGRTATIPIGRQRLQISPAPIEGGMALVVTLTPD
jgi:membrane-associated phospholipid phosphatase